MEPTQTPMDETWLAEQLATKLKVLETLTTTAAIAFLDVRVSVVDLNARASAPGLKAIHQSLERLLYEELPTIVQSLVAQARVDVDQARKALLDYQFKALQPAADTPLAMHDAEATGPAPGEPGSPFPPPPEPALEAGQVSDFRLIDPHALTEQAPDVTIYDKADAVSDAVSDAAWIKF